MSSSGDPTLAGADTLGGPAGSGARPGVEKLLARGDTVGRYLILSVIGKGGMGVVYAAHDPELDRRVALKLVRPGFGPDGPEAARRRLVREAKALAKLSHANVVTVHDVGEFEGGVFIAMEHIDGCTLKKWCEDKHDWPAVRDIFVEAGRGLAAAHRAGIVHRDFKPDNVLVDADGTARVLDFGLAHPEGKTLLTDESNKGTPAYMAVESQSIRVADARGDQFSFCVALYEMLYGERPFPGRTSHEIAANVLRGRVRDAPAGARVPKWLRRVVLRGLGADPEGRWPSMDELIAALGADDKRRRKWSLAVAGGLGLAAVGVATALWGTGRITCDEQADATTQAWGTARADTLRAAFEQTQVTYATDMADRVVEALDEYNAGLQDSIRGACRAARRGEMTTSQYELQRACLAQHSARLAATVDVLVEARAQTVEHAMDTLHALPRSSTCSDPDQQPWPVASAEQTRVTEIRAKLQRARALSRTGRPLEALPTTREALEEAQALGWEQLMAEASMAHADALSSRGDLDEADEALTDAIELAAVAGDARVEADAWLERMFIMAALRGRSEEALRMAPAARSAIVRSGSDPLDEAFLFDIIGTAHLGSGQLEAAEAAYDAAIARIEGADGQSRAALSAMIANRAAIRVLEGDYEGAREQYARSQELVMEELGDKHPSVALGVANVGDTYAAEGDHQGAIERYEQALTSLEQSMGDDAFLTARVRAHRAESLFLTGRTAEAAKTIERALSDLASSVGPAGPDYAAALDIKARILAHRGDFDAADAAADEAIGIFDATTGPSHPARAAIAAGRARWWLQQGQLAQARAELEGALAVLQQRLGPDHPMTAVVMADLAEVLLRTGRIEEARERIGHAVKIAGSRSMPPAERGRVVLIAGWAEAASSEGDLDAARDRGREAFRLFAGLPDHPYARVDASTRFLAAPGAYVRAHVLVPAASTSTAR